TSLNYNLKILRKGGEYNLEQKEKKIHSPIKLVYAGNLFYGRIDTLLALIEKVNIINRNGVKFVISIYTNTIVGNNLIKKLHDNINVFLHSSVSQEELKVIYSKSDIILHVESFKLKYKLLTRLSF